MNAKILFLFLLFIFCLFFLLVSWNPFPAPYPIGVREGSNYIYSMHLYFLLPLLGNIFSKINGIHYRKWADPLIAIIIILPVASFLHNC